MSSEKNQPAVQNQPVAQAAENQHVGLKQPVLNQTVVEAVKQAGQRAVERAQELPEDTDELKQLVKLLLAEKKEALLVNESERGKRIAKQKARNATANENFKKQFFRQAKCKHLKGGKLQKKGAKDPALFCHMYVNREVVVGCFICRARWKSGDTREFVYRNGQKLKNPTKMSFEDAQAMLTESTNTFSSSEIPTQMNEKITLSNGSGTSPDPWVV